MNKKAIAILGAIFLLIVGTLGYLIFAKKTPSTTTDNTVTQNQTNIQPTATPIPTDTTAVDNTAGQTPSTTPQSMGPVKLTSDQVLSPALFYDGTGITYFDNAGNLYQANLQDNNGQLALTTKRQITIPVKNGITKILWPQKGNDFIAELPGITGAQSWSYFNSQLQTYTDLPVQVKAVDWLPSGTKIVYVWQTSDGKFTLNSGDPNTQNWTVLGNMYQGDNKLSVSPDGSQILFYETQNSAVDNAINSVSSDGKIWKTLVKTGYNSGISWSPDGQKFLFAKKDLTTQQYQLWVYNLTSGDVKNLGFFTTVDKTVWDKDSNVIYAAVPKTASTTVGSLTSDDFFRMDTGTLQKKQYDSGSASIDGQNLFLNGPSDKLFFKNLQDGGLYYLDLTQ